jgi:hypothetical protein
LKREVRKRIDWSRKEKRYGNMIKNPLLGVGEGGKIWEYDKEPAPGCWRRREGTE